MHDGSNCYRHQTTTQSLNYRNWKRLLQLGAINCSGEDRWHVVHVPDRHPDRHVSRPRWVPTIARNHQHIHRVQPGVVVEWPLQDQLRLLGALQTKREIAALDLLRCDRVLNVGIRRVWLITINCLNSIKHHRLNWR